MAKKNKKKQTQSLWTSGPLKTLYVLLGIPLVLLMGWYAYTVAFQYHETEMTQMKKDLKKQAKALASEAAGVAERALREGFKKEEFDNCRAMVRQYETPQGWVMTDAKLHELVGLPRGASKQMMDERCVYFAKVVASMERVSHHNRHVFVCGKSLFEIAGGKKYYIRADPKGKGAIQNLTNNKDNAIPIAPGKAVVFNHWQLFNVGDGCLVVGLSKSGTFHMSGHVVSKN